MPQRHPPDPPATPTAAETARTRAGLAFGLGAYVWWGLCSLYFKQLAHVPAGAVLAHRIVWSILLLVALVGLMRQGRALLATFRNRRVLGWLAVSAVLLGINWLVFIRAVGTGRAVEASLGYFINPLVTVVLAMVFLGERLRRAQWVAVGIAGVGVAWFTAVAASRGVTPWIAVTLPATFGLYSLIRKRTDAAPLVGLFIETALLTPAAAAYMAWAHTHPASESLNTAGTLGLLSLSGVVTAVPMLWFVAAAKRLPLATVGFLQYVNPTLQFLVAVVVFKEPFDGGRAAAFAIIWVALGVYVFDLVRRGTLRRAG